MGDKAQERARQFGGWQLRCWTGTDSAAPQSAQLSSDKQRGNRSLSQASIGRANPLLRSHKVADGGSRQRYIQSTIAQGISASWRTSTRLQ